MFKSDEIGFFDVKMFIDFLKKKTFSNQKKKRNIWRTYFIQKKF